MRQKWSDMNVFHQKKTLNYLSGKIKSNPFNKELRQKYFTEFKSVRKLVNQKKGEYKNLVCKKLSDSLINDPKEYWSILKSLKKEHKNQNDDVKELLCDYDKIVDHVKCQGNCENYDIDFKDYIQKEINEIENNISYKDETDKPFSIKEINFVLKKLKDGKACGPDGIVNEIFKYSKSITAKSLAKLFNHILKSGYFPAQWNNSYLTLLHKSGDKSDPSNYRGISLMNCISKNFSAAMNERLKLFFKNKFTNHQFGFRENHRTSDSLFVLKSLTNKYIHKEKKKLYLGFVDFRKAFDSVWRDGLLYKLAKSAVGKQFYQVIKQMMQKTNTAIKFEKLHSGFFEVQRGVKQGDSISPLFSKSSLMI